MVRVQFVAISCLVSILFLLPDARLAQGEAPAKTAPDASQEPPSPKPLAMPEITVTATRYEEKITNVPYNLSTLSKEQMRDKNVTRLNQTFKDTVGIGIPETGNVSDISIIHMRGVNVPSGPLLNDTVGSLLDGLSISKPIPGFSTSFEPGKYPMFNVDRVEILKGPASVLYGKDAFAGVVNLISKKPKPGPVSSELTFFANQWPSYGGSTDVNSGDELLKKQALFNLGFGRHDLSTFRDHSQGTNEQLYGNLAFELTRRTHLRIGGSYTHYRQERPSTLTQAQLDQDRNQAGTPNPGFLETFLTLVPVSLEHQFSKDIKLTNAFLYNNSNDSLDLNDLIVQTNRRRLGDDPSKRVINDTRITWSSVLFDHANELQAGLWVDHFSANFLFKIRELATGAETIREFGNGRQTIFSPYFLNRFNLTERTILWTGLRWDRISMNRVQDVNFGDPGYSLTTTFDAYSPHVGLVYHFTDESSAYFNWSRSFRPISLRAITPTEVGIGAVQEHLTNYEVGARYATSDNRLKVRGAAFWMVYDDQVNSQFRGFDPSALNRDGQSTHRGLEFEGFYELVPRLNAGFSIAYLDAFVNKLRATRSNTLIVLDGARIHNVPRWSLYPSLSYRTEMGLIGTMNGRYIGDRFGDQWNTVKLPSFFLLDLSLGYQPTGKSYGITASLLNIADEKYNSIAVRFDPFAAPTFDPGAPRTFAVSAWARF
jgi:iron complex outermembrane receptor protein